MKHEEEFARLLSEGIHLISIRKGLTIAAVENHLGKALGRKGGNPGSAIAYWRQRNIPANTTDIDGLARHMVDWGGLSLPWLGEFLETLPGIQSSSTTKDDRTNTPLESGPSDISFVVKSLCNGEQIDREELPLTITGQYLPHDGLSAWTLLEDSYGNYYLQDPQVQFLPYDIWIAPNVIPGIGIERIHFMMVNGSGQATFEQMVDWREWGAFKLLPTGSVKLASVEITRV